MPTDPLLTFFVDQPRLFIIWSRIMPPKQVSGYSQAFSTEICHHSLKARAILVQMILCEDHSLMP